VIRASNRAGHGGDGVGVVTRVNGGAEGPLEVFWAHQEAPQGTRAGAQDVRPVVPRVEGCLTGAQELCQLRCDPGVERRRPRASVQRYPGFSNPSSRRVRSAHNASRFVRDASEPGGQGLAGAVPRQESSDATYTDLGWANGAHEDNIWLGHPGSQGVRFTPLGATGRGAVRRRLRRSARPRRGLGRRWDPLWRNPHSRSSAASRRRGPGSCRSPRRGDPS